MKKFYLITQMGLICLSFFAASSGYGQGYYSWYRSSVHLPKWSLELKKGDFEPEEQEFKNFFRGGETDNSSFALGYKILRTVEVGLEYGSMKDFGSTALSINTTGDNDLTYRLQPTHLYVLLRGIWGEDQIGVPYIGAGVTRSRYELDFDGSAAAISGKADGSNTRYGLQILLDQADPSAAAELDQETGINNIYLYVEKQSFDADVSGVDLGGETLFVGLLFEF